MIKFNKTALKFDFKILVFCKTINKIFSNIYDGEILLKVDEKYRVSTQIRNMDSSLLSGDVDRNTAQNYTIIFADKILQ